MPGILRPKGMCLFLGVALAGLSSFQSSVAGANLVIYDSLSPLPSDLKVEDKAHWKVIPSDLLAIEADPPKASSDPGYYGREYAFKGDLIVENASFTAAFSSAQGRVLIYSKADATRTGPAPLPSADPGQKIAEIVPTLAGARPTAIGHCQILRNASDEVGIEASFSAGSSALFSVVFVFGKNEIIEVRPEKKVTGVRIQCPLQYGVVPGFIGDDVLFGSVEDSSTETLYLPAENLFLGLLPGEDRSLVMTWPKGRQALRLQLGAAQQGKRPIEALDFDNDGQNLYLAVLAAPGIWHKESLQTSYLEKDVAAQWKRPFPAKWQTQLDESGVRTTFAFRDAKGQVWRGVPGMYNYPVWFNGDAAYYHLSKKVPPKGDSIVYFIEGQDTPASISTPVDIMKATLGRPMCEAILDLPGRMLRTHHRRGADGVRRACTCGCTEAIQDVFEAGDEVNKRQYINEAITDMIFFVHCHVARINEYQHFATNTIAFLKARESSSPELKPFLENLQSIVQQIPQEYEVQKENMKSLEFAAELAQRTMALTGKKESRNLSAYMELLKEWRAMGGAQDYVVAQCHAITRKLFQEAGYGCARQAKAVELAQEIRGRCRQTLRNPDGYEIWANY